VAPKKRPLSVISNSCKFAVTNAANAHFAASRGMNGILIEPEGSCKNPLYLKGLFYFCAQHHHHLPTPQDFIIAVAQALLSRRCLDCLAAASKAKFARERSFISQSN
jgi:hypothetical protein